LRANNVENFGCFIHGGLRQVVITWLYHERDFDLPKAADELTDAVYAAVAPVILPYVCPFAQANISAIKNNADRDSNKIRQTSK